MSGTCATGRATAPAAPDLGALHLHHLVVAPADHADVVLHDPLAQLAELPLHLVADPGEERGLVQPLPLSERRHLEERAHERRALHPVAELRVAGLLRRDLEPVQGVDLDVVGLDEPLGLRREVVPQHLGRQVGLDHEHAAPAHPGQRVGVAEDVGIRRQHHVHVLELGVDLDRLAGQRGVERGGLALLLGPVLGVRLDVQARQLEGRERDVLAHGDGAPAAHGVDPQRDGALGQEVQTLHRLQGQLRQVRVRLQQLLLPDLQLGQLRVLADEVDPQVELAALLAVVQHVVHRGHQVTRLEVPAAEAETGAVEVGDLVRRDRGHAGVGHIPPAVLLARPLAIAQARRPAVLHGLGHGGPDLPQQGASTASGWSVRSRTVTAFLPASSSATRSAGKGRNMTMSSTPTLSPFSLRR
jgi:hypothetical protein